MVTFAMSTRGLFSHEGKKQQKLCTVGGVAEYAAAAAAAAPVAFLPRARDVPHSDRATKLMHLTRDHRPAGTPWSVLALFTVA